MRKSWLLVVSLGLLIIITFTGYSSADLWDDIKEYSCKLYPTDYSGAIELEITLILLNDFTLGKIFTDQQAIDQVKKVIGEKKAFLLAATAQKDTYFSPTDISIIQDKRQYNVGFDNFIRIEGEPGHLRLGTRVTGIVLFPPALNTDKDMTIHYDKTSILFQLPKSKAITSPSDIESQI